MTHDTPIARGFRTVCGFGWLGLVAIALLPGGCNPTAAGVTTVRVTEEVILEAPARLGVNLGASTYYADQQLVADPFSHGAFPRGMQTTLIVVGAATGNSVTDSYMDPDDPDRHLTESMAGGRYHIATGARAGESGEIVEHDPRTGRYTLEHDGAPLVEGDAVWMRGPGAARALPDPAHGERPVGIGDFRHVADTGVTLDFVEARDGGTNQALRIAFPAGEGRLRGGVKHYIKATPDTTYRVRIRARGDAREAVLGVQFTNYGVEGPEPGRTVPMVAESGRALSDDWREYVFEGRTLPTDSIADGFSEILVAVTAEAGETPAAVYVDHIQLDDELLAHPTGFARQVVDALTEARCGVLRFYGIASLSTLVESVTAESAAHAPWTFHSLASGYRMGRTHAVADQWLALADTVGARPWLVVGGPNTPDDWHRLISYLAAPAGFDDDAARRAAHGRATPWTEAFDKLYLEIGNEWWNPIFRPYYIWDAEKYAELCNGIIARVRAHPHFDPERVEIVVGGWAINAHQWNTRLDAAAEGHDRLSLAPYLVHELNAHDSDADKFATVFADVDGYLQGGGRSTLKGLRDNAKDTGLAVYELNTHITGGAAPASVASEIAPSVAAGVAVLNQAMHLMTHLRTDPINYFTLLQRGYGHGDQRRLGLWGNLVRLPDGSLRPRPVWQGLRLANQYVIDGDLVRTTVSGGPTWRQPKNGNVPAMDAVPYIHAYAFLTRNAAGKRQANVLIINRHLDAALPVRLELPFGAYANEATQAVLTGFLPGDHNEEGARVDIETSRVRGLTPGGTVAAPPFSALALQIVEN